MYDVGMDSQLQISTSIATTKDPHSQSSARTTTISLVDTLLFLGTPATPPKYTWTCSSSPSATLTTFLPPSTPSNQTLPVESSVAHHGVHSLVDMISSSTPTPTKTTATTPSSHTTTSTPLGKETTPSLAQRNSPPTRLKSTLFSKGTQTREERWGWQREEEKKIECQRGECMDD